MCVSIIKKYIELKNTKKNYLEYKTYKEYTKHI